MSRQRCHSGGRGASRWRSIEKSSILSRSSRFLFLEGLGLDFFSLGRSAASRETIGVLKLKDPTIFSLLSLSRDELSVCLTIAEWMGDVFIGGGRGQPPLKCAEDCTHESNGARGLKRKKTLGKTFSLQLGSARLGAMN